MKNLKLPLKIPFQYGANNKKKQLDYQITEGSYRNNFWSEYFVLYSKNTYFFTLSNKFFNK